MDLKSELRKFLYGPNYAQVDFANIPANYIPPLTVDQTDYLNFKAELLSEISWIESYNNGVPVYSKISKLNAIVSYSPDVKWQTSLSSNSSDNFLKGLFQLTYYYNSGRNVIQCGYVDLSGYGIDFSKLTQFTDINGGKHVSSTDVMYIYNFLSALKISYEERYNRYMFYVNNVGKISPNLVGFNWLIMVRDHYTLYQTTSFLFSDGTKKERLSYIIGKNFLKLLSANLTSLTPAFYATNGQSDLWNFLSLTTMGYLRQGDIITTDLIPYFKVDDEITGIMNRISAISPLVNGNKVVPTFVTNIIGTDVTPTSVPNGKMVMKVINDVLVEADRVFTWMGL